MLCRSNKPLPQTVEGCNDEIQKTENKIRQLTNRNKILDKQIAAETRRERNHRIFLYGGFVDSTAPEIRGMTDEEAKDFLYHALHSEETRELLRKRAEAGTPE